MRKTFLLLFAQLCFLTLFGCSKAPDQEWTVTSTGIKHGDFYWCDADHLAAKYLEAGNGYNFTNLYFDARDFKNSQRIEAKDENGTPLSISVKQCEKNTFIFFGGGAGGGKYGLYRMPLNGRAELLAVPKDHSLGGIESHNVSLNGKIIVEPMPRKASGDTYIADPECTSYVHPNFTLLCLDIRNSQVIALSRFVITSYLWQDRVPIRSIDGKSPEIQVRNPQPPLTDDAGKPFTSAIFLRDLNGKVLLRLDNDPVYKTDALLYVAGPDDAYLYSPCKKISKSKFSLDYDRVCRYPLDGSMHAWEEIFSFDMADKLKSGIQHISIDAVGNVYFDMPGIRGKSGGIWKFDVAHNKVIHVVAGDEVKFDTRPVVSIDGKKLAFDRDHILHIAYSREN